MSRSVTARRTVVLGADDALALWADVRRWPSFVEGFARYVSVDDAWPVPGSRVVWESGPDGRGRVTEKVAEHGERSFATEVFENRLRGRQAARFADAGPGQGAQVELRLDYELAKGGPLQAIADALFIRPALRTALERTLRAFAVEAQDDAGLR